MIQNIPRPSLELSWKDFLRCVASTFADGKQPLFFSCKSVKRFKQLQKYALQIKIRCHSLIQFIFSEWTRSLLAYEERGTKNNYERTKTYERAGKMAFIDYVFSLIMWRSIWKMNIMYLTIFVQMRQRNFTVWNGLRTLWLLVEGNFLKLVPLFHEHETILIASFLKNHCEINGLNLHFDDHV